jgi:hypothetical protein
MTASRLRKFTMISSLLFALPLTHCKAADSAIEVKLCEETIKATCDKLNECTAAFPALSATVSLYLQSCNGDMAIFCASDELYGCDIDNAKLSACNDGIKNLSCSLSAFSQIPSECYTLLDCW